MKTAIITALVIPSLALSMFLTYKILTHIEATELMWFVFIINLPFAITIGVLSKTIGSKK